MPICGSNFGKKLQLLTSIEILVEVEHVNAHRTKQEKKDMSHFETFVTEGNKKADELAKAGAMLDKGFMAEARAKKRSKKEKKCAQACSNAASFHFLVEE